MGFSLAVEHDSNAGRRPFKRNLRLNDLATSYNNPLDQTMSKTALFSQRAIIIDLSQETHLFRRSPCHIADGDRRRPPCSADGRRPRPESMSEGTAELYELEADINSTAFEPVATGGRMDAHNDVSKRNNFCYPCVEKILQQ